MTAALQPDHVSHQERYNVKHATQGHSLAAVFRLTHTDDQPMYTVDVHIAQLSSTELRMLGEHLVAVADLDQQR